VCVCGEKKRKKKKKEIKFKKGVFIGALCKTCVFYEPHCFCPFSEEKKIDRAPRNPPLHNSSSDLVQNTWALSKACRMTVGPWEYPTFDLSNHDQVWMMHNSCNCIKCYTLCHHSLALLNYRLQKDNGY